MEEEKKKNKNKKKKNKQAKTAEAVAVGIEGSVSAYQTVSGFERDHQGRVFKNADIANDLPKSDIYLDRHHTSGSEDVSLEEQIKHLQKEKDAYISKEVDVGLKISQLQNEKDFWHQKETSLEEQIKQLQEEKDAYISKEADLGLIISQLEDEKECWLQKEVGLEEKIKQLETERESWAQKENFIKGTIVGLNADNTRLRSQVTELEESLKNLLQENQQLKENISGLHSQIQNSAHLSTCDSLNEDMKSEMLAAQTMIKKLLSENAELVEKLKAEHDQKGTTAELSSSVGPDPMVGTVAAALVEGSAIASDQMDGTAERLTSVPVAENSALGPDPTAGTTERFAGDIIVDALFESSESPPLLSENMKPIENVGSHSPEKDVGNYANHKNPDGLPNDETIVSEEIVQIPLDENEVGATKLELEDSRSVETANVPISDAPLIGAPFRLISFVARYVSGADLVDKNHLKSGR